MSKVIKIIVLWIALIFREAEGQENLGFSPFSLISTHLTTTYNELVKSYRGIRLLYVGLKSMLFDSDDDLISFIKDEERSQTELLGSFSKNNRTENRFTPLNNFNTKDEVNFSLSSGHNTRSSKRQLENLCRRIGVSVPGQIYLYFCFGLPVDKEEYERVLKLHPLSCYKQKKPISVCVCPDDYNGDNCEIHIRTTCMFKKLIYDGVNLMENKDILYDEYLRHNPVFLSLKNLSDPMSFNMSLKCKMKKTEKKNYTEIFERRGIEMNNTSELDNIKFNYFINEGGVTLSKTPSISFSLKFYDMKTLLPALNIEFYANTTTVRKILLGNEEVNFNVNLTHHLNEQRINSSIFEEKLIVAGRIFYILDIRDYYTESVDFMKYQGVFEVLHPDSFIQNSKEKQSWLTISIIVLASIVLLLTITFILCRNKRRKILNISSQLPKNGSTGGNVNYTLMK